MPSKEASPTAALPRIVIPVGDYERLISILEDSPQRDSPALSYLARELDRADVVADEAWADRIVRIGAEVSYRDDLDGTVRTVRLVWPQQADIEHRQISVLSPVGAALLGMSVGHSIDWPSPAGGPGSLTVLAIGA